MRKLLFSGAFLALLIGGSVPLDAQGGDARFERLSVASTAADALRVAGGLTVGDDADVGGTLTVTGMLTAEAEAAVGGTLTVTGMLTAEAEAAVGGTLMVTGILTAADDADVGGALTVGEDADVEGGITALAFTGNGSALTNLNAAAITTNLVNPLRLGSGTPAVWTYLRGDGVWAGVSPPTALDWIGGFSTTSQVYEEIGLSITLDVPASTSDVLIYARLHNMRECFIEVKFGATVLQSGGHGSSTRSTVEYNVLHNDPGVGSHTYEMLALRTGRFNAPDECSIDGPSVLIGQVLR